MPSTTISSAPSTSILIRSGGRHVGPLHELVERDGLDDDLPRLCAVVVLFARPLDVQRVKRRPRRDEHLGRPGRGGKRLVDDHHVGQAVQRDVVTQRHEVLRDRLERIHPALWTDQLGAEDREEANVRADVVDRLPRLDQLSQGLLDLWLGVAGQIAHERAAQVDPHARHAPAHHAQVAMADRPDERLHHAAPERAGMLDLVERTPQRAPHRAGKTCDPPLRAIPR
jgi:hypothetical protein